MSSGDRIRATPDAPWREAGTGHQVLWRCMGCDKPRSRLGAKGRGVAARCAVCVAEREKARAG